jgi:hypothetical protein
MSEELLQSIKARAQNPQTINDMAAGMSPAGQLPPVTGAEKVADAETRLGFALPELLRRMYCEIADGGFGPGYGLVGIEGDRNSYLGSSLVDSYQYYLQESDKEFGAPWQPRLLPILTWGCGILSCVDCADPAFPVYFLDPGMHCLDDPGIEATLTLADGTVQKIENPFANPTPAVDDKPTGLQPIMQAGSLDEFMKKWVDGVNLWDEIAGEG